MDKLSDAQLYALVINHDLSGDLKEKANAEFQKRNFPQEYIDKLALEYENIMPSSKSGLTIGEKIRIIAFPFFVPIQSIIANRYISKGNTTGWKMYWKYLAIGWLMWTILFFLAVELFYKQLKA
jgi:hypothetical protein